MPEMTIGRAATTAGVKIDTIRYYQRRSLVDEPALPIGGQRKYGDDTVRRVKFIKRAQTLGFTLEETKSLLSFERARSCTATRKLAEHKVVEIDARIVDLRRMRKTLAALALHCESSEAPGHCPIIDTLMTG